MTSAAVVFPWMLLTWLLSKRPPTAAAPAVTPRPKPVRPPPGAAAPPAMAKPPPSVTVPASYKPTPTPQPWPQVVPQGLPGFPGPEWAPDDPPGAGVVARATQLIPVLWQHGPGTFKVEQTSGRWITYRATPMGSKRGVVAFKLATEPSLVIPSSAPAPTPRPEPASVSPTTLRTLRLKSPRMTGQDVITLQTRLGVIPDGVFGGGTQTAVIAHQRANGLVPDGVVGPKTWSSVLSGGRAAASARAPAPSRTAIVPASTASPVSLQTLRLRSPRMTGPDVVTLQRRLGITADGIFGAGTHSAVVTYQRSRGLLPDGIVGPKTWSSLFGGGSMV